MANTVATWGGLEIQLVSEDVVTAVDTAKGFLEVLNNALSVALAAGEIAKTFVTSNLNLARSLVREILNSLRNLIQDFFSLGVYANFSDIQLLQRGTASLKGGYAAWQRRMLAQLNNRNDPNRPDFTPSSTVLGVFFYVGVPDYVDLARNIINTERFAPLRQFLRAFANLFGLSFGTNNSLPVAVNLRAEYATPGNVTARDPSLALSSFLGRSRLQVVWNSAPAPGGGNEPEPTIPPCGFIVEVSCYPKGFSAAWIGPTPSGTGIGEGSNQAYTTGQYQAGNSGQPLVIFGGEDAILLEGDVQWPAGFTPGDRLSDGNHPLYFYRDAATPEVIRKAFAKGPEEIENGRDVTRYYNQKRFFVTKAQAIAQGVFEGNYSITLTENDLPLYCPIVNGVIDTSRPEVPRAVYVRVIPVSNRVDENNFRQAQWKPRAWTSSDQTLVHINPITITGDPQPLGDNDLGTPSEVLEVLVPSVQQNLYARALQTAIAITTLSRSDLKSPDPVAANQRPPEDSTYRETGLESIATEIDQRMQIRNPSDYYSQVSATQSPQAFVGDLYPRIVAETDRYLRSQGELPQALLDSLEPTLESLVNWNWSDTDTPIAAGNPALRCTVLQSLQFNNADTPLSRNRKSTRRYYSDRNGTPSAVLQDLETKWREGTFGTTYHPASVDSSPVIGPSDGASPQYWYARDLIPEDIYAKAATVMALTSSQTTTATPGAWVSQRVFAPRSATGSALTVLNKVDGFFNTVFAGLQTGADGILRVIDFLQQRVREIQELIRRIETLLDVPFQLSFPSAKALVLVTNGTSGLITGLLSAQEKPQEGPKDYAGGGILVAGSAPSILIDLLAKGLQSSTGG